MNSGPVYPERPHCTACLRLSLFATSGQAVRGIHSNFRKRCWPGSTTTNALASSDSVRVWRTSLNCSWVVLHGGRSDAQIDDTFAQPLHEYQTAEVFVATHKDAAFLGRAGQ